MKKLYLLLFFFTSFIYAQDPFITTWQVEGSDLTVAIPIIEDSGNNYSIDFGDGTLLTNQTGPVSHTYSSAGTYTVIISGSFGHIKHYNMYGNSEAAELLTIQQWGDNVWTSMEGAFAFCSNMTITATDVPNLTEVTDMSYMFAGCDQLNQPLNSWNVSNVTNMKNLFDGANLFNQPLNNWNVSNVTDMSYMFYFSNVFNQPLNDWNVSNVTDMNNMFRGAHDFNQPLNNWDVSNVVNMESMFSQTDFNQNINNWDVSSVTNMKNMFAIAMTYNQPLDNWDVSNVTDMSGMFTYTVEFNQPLNSWNVSNVTTMDSMFSNTHTFNQPLDQWDISNVTSTYSMFHGSAFNQPIGNWDVSNVTAMGYMFKSSAFNQPINDWNVSNVTGMWRMFESSPFNHPLNDWDVSNVTNMESMFEVASAFNQPLNNWDVSNVTNMTRIFRSAANFNQDLSSWAFTNSAISSDMVRNSGLDTNNYDLLLTRFAQLGFENKWLTATGLEYCDGDVRQYLINELGWNITQDTVGDDCAVNIVSGSVLYDVNGNGCGIDDVSINNLLVNVSEETTNYTSAAINGEYSLNLFQNTYTVSLLNVPAYFAVSPQQSTITFTGSDAEEEINFCLTANQVVSDLNITLLPLNEARPGFETNYQLVVQNMGTQTVANAAVSLTFDNTLQSFVTATPAPASTTANQLDFTVADLQPFESSMIDFTMETMAPPAVNGGEIANFTAALTPNTNDYTPDDNTFELAQEVVNSFDPNDKRVLQGEEIFITQTDEYLDYIIRFQNTGSASAITVRVVDELHDKLDWTTLTPVSASHDYRVEITDGNRVEFIFNDINLPHQAANDEGSNGYIAYKIKPVEGTEIGDIITGNASIYFDYNLPIVTNTVSTEVVTNLSITDNALSNSVSIYPNPANNVLHIEAKDGFEPEEVKIISIQGRELIAINKPAESINLAGLSPGIYIVAIKTNAGVVTHKLVKD